MSNPPLKYETGASWFNAKNVIGWRGNIVIRSPKTKIRGRPIRGINAPAAAAASVKVTAARSRRITSRLHLAPDGRICQDEFATICKQNLSSSSSSSFFPRTSYYYARIWYYYFHVRIFIKREYVKNVIRRFLRKEKLKILFSRSDFYASPHNLTRRYPKFAIITILVFYNNDIIRLGYFLEFLNHKCIFRYFNLSKCNIILLDNDYDDHEWYTIIRRWPTFCDIQYDFGNQNKNRPYRRPENIIVEQKV